MCVSKPKYISGNPVFLSKIVQENIHSNAIEPQAKGTVTICNSNDVWSIVNAKDLMIQLAKNNIDKQMDRLIEYVNNKQL